MGALVYTQKGIFELDSFASITVDLKNKSQLIFVGVLIESIAMCSDAADATASRTSCPSSTAPTTAAICEHNPQAAHGPVSDPKKHRPSQPYCVPHGP